MRSDDRNEEQRRCGRCGRSLRPNDVISVAEVGERCDRCFNEELAQRLGVDFDAKYALEVGQREARGGYRFAILGDRAADVQELLTRPKRRLFDASSELIRRRIRWMRDHDTQRRRRAGSVQLSNLRSATRSNSVVLFVTSVSPRALAWAAMNRSLAPIIAPLRFKSARISA